MGVKLSRFVLAIKINKEGDIFLVNTLNHAMAEISSELLALLKGLPHTTGEIHAEELQMLQQAGFLIDEDIDEVAVAKYELHKRTFNPTSVFLTLLVTYHCNFACTYCYESGVVRYLPYRMDSSMCAQVWNFIQRFLDCRIPYFIDVNFFGGEPLMNFGAIEYFAERLKNFAKLKNIRLNYYICTNGSLLTSKVINKLSQWQPVTIQISLDGPPAVHNQRRPFRGNRASFHVILENMKQALQHGLPIVLAVTIDKHNLPSMPEFLNLLDRELEAYKDRVVISFCPTTQTACANTFCTVYELSNAEKARESYKLFELAYTKGFRIGRMIGHGICHFDGDNNLIIDPKGDIYKCLGGVGLEQFRVGSVFDDPHKFAVRWAQFVGKQYWNNEQCLQCAYLPICGGGCRYVSYVETKNMDRPYCLRTFFDQGMIGIMRLLALQRKQAGETERRSTTVAVPAS